ncbi:hypothetical protein [Flavobacterium nackdongense]|uniref:Carboxypeptidase-like regulatory domain-containing protein n=1 Tax=Flavobacterium nackdongense TaxID=2547394 RepID=A0A4P6YDE6_9FLAO|nr:hypothetical protein [Flavobacterium nackdongense]QBN18785.1 hypothetical protein E1750_08205 [Flavobacterium nackdongense]
MRKFDFLILFVLCQFSYGQTGVEKLIHGKISVASGSVEGVNIMNLVNEKSSMSDSNGEFYILAKADDLLVFSAVNLEYHRRSIEESDLKSDIVIIKMISKTTELKEVQVNNYPEINAVSLGISPKGIKKYTPAERKLATASSMRLNPMGLDPLLNAISGRTKMLKKDVEVEKKLRSLSIMNALYTDDAYFTQTLKIPADYIKGFQYYCIENNGFAEALKTKNKTKIEFLIVPLALQFNKIRTEE